jgi:hypothetical protein
MYQHWDTLKKSELLTTHRKQPDSKSGDNTADEHHGQATIISYSTNNPFWELTDKLQLAEWHQ